MSFELQTSPFRGRNRKSFVLAFDDQAAIGAAGPQAQAAMAYGVATTNVFELLGDSDGAEDATPVVKAPEPKKKEAPSKAADAVKADVAGQQHVPATILHRSFEFRRAQLEVSVGRTSVYRLVAC